MKKKRGARRSMPLYVFGRFLLTLFYYPVFRLRVRGRENIPKAGPVLLCCNHMAKRDPVMLGVAVNGRQVCYMAKEELFENRFLGGVLRRYREGRGLAQDEFAELCGISRAYYGRIERGEHSPTVERCQLIASALHVRLADLFSELPE